VTTRESRVGSRFDLAAFCTSLDAVRASQGLTWRGVAGAAGVSPSTLTRMNQGKRPDVDGLAALCAWSGLTDLRPFTVGAPPLPASDEAYLVFAPPRPESRCQPEIFADRDRAHEHAGYIDGVVCAVPIIADYRAVAP
jgi:transcriptional regulator with XRE-family HTH domain